MKKVLIVEDHPLVSESTKELLLKIDASLDIVITSSLETAIKAFKEEKSWHRIFMDLDVPGAYGLALARTFQKLGAAGITTIVTAFDNHQWRAEAQKMGLLGYIIKATPYAKYITSLNSVLDGIRAFPDAGHASDNVPHLTRRQIDVLDLLHRGLSSSDMAQQLCVTEGHINNIVQNIKSALRANSRSHAVSRAIELGYIKMHDYQKK